MDEIQVNPEQLSEAISKLAKLSVEKKIPRHAASSFINQSSGQMFRAVNSQYEKLCAIEDSLIELINNTKTAMRNAGVSFVTVDSNLGKMFSDLTIHAMEK